MIRRHLIILALVSVLAACARKPDYGARGRGGTAGGVAGHGGAATGGGAGARGGSGGADGSAGTGGGAGAGTGGAAGVFGPGSGVLQHHNHASRDGLYIDPALTKAAVASLHIDPTFSSPTLVGAARAQLLYLDGVGGRPDLVFAATKENHVYALNAATGAVAWDVVVGPAAIRPDTTCSPGPVGIIGTPIIDGGRRIIYLDGMTAVPDADGGSANKHLVFALDADTGAVRPGWPVDVDAKARAGTLAFDSTNQNQRGALALVGGTLYIPYGGFGGDCGIYHGWVVGISTSDPTRVSAWATRAIRAGIWAPGGVVSDGSSLFVTTGNAAVGTTPWQDSEALIKLPLSLAASDGATDYYAPTNWMDMDTKDADLGGTAPLLVDVPGATPSALVVALGKDARAYLVDRAHLGGIGDPLFGALVAGEAIVTAPATFKTAKGVFVTFRAFGSGVPILAEGHITVFMIKATTPPSMTGVWCGGPASFSAPTVSVTSADGTDAMIWMVGLVDNKLHAHDGETGQELFAGGADLLTGVQKFQPVIVAHGRLFIVGDRVYAFTP